MRVIGVLEIVVVVVGTVVVGVGWSEVRVIGVLEMVVVGTVGVVMMAVVVVEVVTAGHIKERLLHLFLQLLLHLRPREGVIHRCRWLSTYPTDPLLSLLHPSPSLTLPISPLPPSSSLTFPHHSLLFLF